MRLVYWICLCYWLLMCIRPGIRTDSEMVDQISASISLFGVLVFALILGCLYWFGKNEKLAHRIHVLAAIPSVLTGLFLVLGLLAVLSSLGG
ncbi:MAG: hypothetical protein AAFV95_26885 [Bacteroidota bacterium]